MSDEKNKVSIEKLGEALHNKSPLPSLRTYQGDMAKFIKDKNESVISIAVKEKARKESRPEEQKKSTQNFHINITILLSSFLLITAGVLAIFYLLGAVGDWGQKDPDSSIASEIPFSTSINLSNSSKETFAYDLLNISPNKGITEIKISNNKGEAINNTQKLIAFLKITPPPALIRTIKEDYFLGIISDENKNVPFMILNVEDFGVGFSSMLDWEDYLDKDFWFISPETSTSTKNNFQWKDVIVKNKDTRVLINKDGVPKMAYTFLEKKMILITDSPASINKIYSAYITRPFVQ